MPYTEYRTRNCRHYREMLNGQWTLNPANRMGKKNAVADKRITYKGKSLVNR
ncbi:MAG: hypothetical protein NUV44_06825 [Candidatus Scalindua sp.]|nr:hypothetical protein [Candidatus Scalindua sp.]